MGINFGQARLARAQGHAAETLLRFDDTNPAAEVSRTLLANCSSLCDLRLFVTKRMFLVSRVRVCWAVLREETPGRGFLGLGCVLCFSPPAPGFCMHTWIGSVF